MAILELAPEKEKFVRDNLEKGISATMISKAYQRRFNTVLRPQDIENMRIMVPKPKRKDVEEIKSKLGSHDQQLEYARAKLLQRMDDEDITNNDLVNLAREFRSNITASQQLASMNDERGEAQYILVYGDTVQQSSQFANVEDVDFTVLGGTNE
jgi:hypothetical protein